MIYRITGRTTWFDPETRQRVASTDRVTVRRSQRGDLAYYEDLQHAKHGLVGLKSGNTYYVDFQIESNACVWEPLTSEE